MVFLLTVLTSFLYLFRVLLWLALLPRPPALFPRPRDCTRSAAEERHAVINRSS